MMLLATLAFAALWFVALRPKAEEAAPATPATPAAQTPAPAPAQSAIPGAAGNVLDTARQGAAQANA